MWKVIKGQVWAWRLSWHGRGRGRRALGFLITGALLCLVIPALIPHPNPMESRYPLRRINYEDENTYTAQRAEVKVEAMDVYMSESANGVAVTSPPPTTTSQLAAVLKKSPSPPIPAATNQTRVFSKLQGTSRQAKMMLARAREGALNALQHGYRLTQVQKKIIQEMDPNDKKSIEDRLAKTRIAQDRIYMTHLRTRKQMVPRRGGGEEIISLANKTIRFPVMLKKIAVSKWPSQYAVYTNLTHYPWNKNGGECAKFSISFARLGTLPRRGLASFPSSGNTWVRYLIEGATGIFTGSMYDDNSLMMKGMYGEALLYDSGMTILQKTHGYTTGEAMTITDRRLRSAHNHLFEMNHRGVVVVRNPFKALISHRHLDVGGHMGYAPKGHFLGEGWSEFVRLKVQLWRDFYEDWATLTKPSDTLFIHYENIRDDPVGEMQSVLEYLGITENPLRLSCLGRNLDGLFKRKPRRHGQLEFNPFTEDLKGVVYDAIGRLDGVLRERGKNGLPLEKYEMYDEEEAKAFGRRNIGVI